LSTRGVKFLEKQKIDFELIRYEHLEKGAAFAAKSTGFSLTQTIKTLVIDLGHKTYCLAMLPGDKQLNLKKIAKVCGAKRSAMVDTITAERITGYKVGGISPFGTQQKMEAVLDSSLISFESVLINAGQRGSLVRLSPADIRKSLNCRVEDISE